MIYKLILTLILFGLTSGQLLQANEIEDNFTKAGLVDVQTMDPSIHVNLVNSNPDNNYFRENYYKGLNKAYLQKEVAVKLVRAQQLLKASYPGYSLLILDAARPRSVSTLMYEKMKGTKYEKYVANPKTGSMHNYGVAVDITIVNKKGESLDMGLTPFFKSDLQLTWQVIKMKLGSKPTAQQLANRKLLASIMKEAGFYPLGFEWWHFNGLPKKQARQRFKIIE